MLREKEDGFTLIEILVGVLIAGILMAIAIPSFANLRKGNIEDQLVLDGKKLNTMVKEKFEGRGGTLVPFNKFMFPDAHVSKGSKWKVISTETGYCVAIWNPEATQHNSQEFAYIWEGSVNACSNNGFGGTVMR